MKIAILVDANIYVDLYRGDARQKLLPSLVKLPGLFVSRQIVDEVTRNRIEVGTEQLNAALAKTARIDLPPQVTSAFDVSLTNNLKEFNNAASKLQRSLDGHLATILAGMVEGSDPVTSKLQQLFARAASPTPAEMTLARERRERGNPPGKRGDPLGDQLTWEQFLSYCRNAKRIVVVSRDGDHDAGCKGHPVLDALLAADLQRVAPGCRTELYVGLADALDALRDVAGAKIPSADEIKKAKETEEAAAAVEGVTLLESLGVRTVLPTMFLGGSLGGPSWNHFQEAARRQLMRGGGSVVEVFAPVLPPQGVPDVRGPGAEQGRHGNEKKKDEK